MSFSNLRIAYLCIEGGPHPAHRRWINTLLNSANTQIIYIPSNILSRIIPTYVPFNKKYDAAIIDGFTPLPLGWFMKKTGLCKKLAFITTSPAFAYLFKLSNLLLEDVDLIIALSSLMCLVVEKMFKFKNRKRIVICHPIPEISSFLKVKPSLNSQRICFIGSFSHVKGVNLLPKIITKVRTRFREAELLVIGKGTTKLNKVEGMKILGYVHHDILPSHLSSCSIYLHPARFDAFPVSTIEAMAAGLIPVVTEMTGSKDIVKEVSSDLIAPVNVDALADKIIQILSMSHSERIKLSEKAKKVAQSFIVNAEKDFLQVLNKLLKDTS
ncbi:MAG: glycosyltransferase family 4 protein [Candidatus Bathyarchaeia archaeon]